MTAMSASEDWNEEDLFRLVRQIYCYRDLTREDFDAVIDMLSEGISTKRGRSGAFLHRDRVHSIVRGRRCATMRSRGASCCRSSMATGSSWLRRWRF